MNSLMLLLVWFSPVVVVMWAGLGEGPGGCVFAAAWSLGGMQWFAAACGAFRMDSRAPAPGSSPGPSTISLERKEKCMAGETHVTLVGNLTADPELRTLSNGSTVVNLTIASTARSFNRESKQWEDGDALFMRCSAWGDEAAHVASSLAKGMRVIASGTLRQRSYQAQDGSNRTITEMLIEEIGPSLRYATAQVQRVRRDRGFAGSAYTGGATQTQSAQAVPDAAQSSAPAVGQSAAPDPWSQPDGGWE